MHVNRSFRFMPTNAYTHNKSLNSVFLLFILNLSSCITKNYTQIKVFFSLKRTEDQTNKSFFFIKIDHQKCIFYKKRL